MFIDTLRRYSDIDTYRYNIISMLGDNKDTLKSVYEKGEYHGISWNIPRGGMFSSMGPKTNYNQTFPTYRRGNTGWKFKGFYLNLYNLL